MFLLFPSSHHDLAVPLRLHITETNAMILMNNFTKIFQASKRPNPRDRNLLPDSRLWIESIDVGRLWWAPGILFPSTYLPGMGSSTLPDWEYRRGRGDYIFDVLVSTGWPAVGLLVFLPLTCLESGSA